MTLYMLIDMLNIVITKAYYSCNSITILQYNYMTQHIMKDMLNIVITIYYSCYIITITIQL